MSSPLNRSFNHQEHDLYTAPCLTPTGKSRKTSPSVTPPTASSKTSPCSSPTKRSSKTNNKEIKNPYSTRGLDKFSALLADLEEKKQKIYSQKDAEKISLVRFAYSSSTNDVVPIVVKLKDKDNQDKRQEDSKQDKATYDNKYPIESSSADARLQSEKKTKKINLSWNLGNLNHPSFYVPAVIIFILVALAVFGRSAAILFTSIGWYIVPTITGDTLKSKKKSRRKKDLRRLNMNKISDDGLKKKEYVRKPSEIKMVSDGLIASPKKVNNNGGAVKNESPGGHGHRKSW